MRKTPKLPREAPEKGGKMRINQFLARSGVASRRSSEILILEGNVTLNGQRVSDLATLVDPVRDSVKVAGERVRLIEHAAYFILYKPKMVVSTMEDPEGRPCLTGLLPKGNHGLFPVGRLDFHSEGLLLLTNDGEMTNRLLHPRYKVVKTYQVKVKGHPDPESLARLKRGVVLEGRRTLPVSIRRIPSRETLHTWLAVEMMEGRKNQLREMFFRIDHPVIKLKRVAMGPLKLGALKPGQTRPLTREEVQLLMEAAGLGPGGAPGKPAPKGTGPRREPAGPARDKVPAKGARRRKGEEGAS
jgi:23S rRNA pseudouridine2605 synthase